MKIDYRNETLAIKGSVYTMESFKVWYMKNYQSILHKYHVKGNVFDWHSILSDVQQNGIIEIFNEENNG